jgi:hypothetical protein
MDRPKTVVCSLLVNRLVRTRMLGGVGGLDTPGYPIRPTQCAISFQLHELFFPKLQW